MANTQFGGAESVESYRKKIMTCLKKNGRTPLSDRDLATKCRTNRGGAANFRQAINELRHEGAICERRRGYVSSANMGYFPATIVRLSRTFGFARPEEEGAQDVFIPGKFLQGAMTKDRVLIGNIPSRSGKPEGEVLAILEEADSKLTGVIIDDNGRLMFRADTMSKTPIQIQRKDSVIYHEGEKVLAEVVYRGQRHAEHKVKIVYSFGVSTRASVCAEAIVAIRGVNVAFPEEVVAEAEQLANAPIPQEEYEKRLDLRSTPIFTIDSAHSKDLDDAVSLEKTASGYKLGVHIADVSHYVPEGSIIDREALKRSTSVYLVDRTIPMLPERLCNYICSLRPDEDKLAYSVIFTLNEKAEIQNWHLAHTVIRSNRRFTYEEVQQVLEAHHEASEEDYNSPGDHYEPLTPDAEPAEHFAKELIMLNRMAKELRRRRFAGGAIDFDRCEVRFEIDEKGKPTSVFFKVSKDANKLIEEFMLLANRTVAESIGKVAKGQKAKVFVYRIHDTPDPQKLMNLADFVGKFGYKLRTTGTKDDVSRNLNKLLREVKGRKEQNVVEMVSLRAMMKAKYSVQNVGHYGLAFRYYTHFTSPIRRYPDLMVHRLLTRYAEGGRSVGRDKYEELCEHCSEMEQTAAQAERSSIKYKQVEFMKDRLGEVFEGTISGVTEFGLYVEVNENKCEGMVPLRDLKDDYYEFDEKNFCLRGRATHHCYNLGDAVKIQVARADLFRKQLDYKLVRE